MLVVAPVTVSQIYILFVVQAIGGAPLQMPVKSPSCSAMLILTIPEYIELKGTRYQNVVPKNLFKAQFALAPPSSAISKKEPHTV